MSGASTSLIRPGVAESDQYELETCLRGVLERMASALDDAYELHPHGGVVPLVMAKRYADIVGISPDEGAPVIGAWFVSGKYAGLSIVSGMLCRMDLPTAYENLQALAELRFHSQDLMVGVPPFADEMNHAGFQESYQRVLQAVEESRAM